MTSAFLDLIPLGVETPDSIRARVDSDANAGIAPSDPAFIDTTEGGMYFDVTQPVILELARIYDAIFTEVPASMFLGLTWGIWLDYWGVNLGVVRKDAAKALGEVTFTGTQGTLIATDTQVAPPQTDPDVEPPIFRTTASGTIPVGGTLTLAIEADEAGTAGNVAPGTITQLVSPITGGVSSLTNALATSGGVEVESDEAYRNRLLLEVATPAGAGNQGDYVRWALAYPGVGYAVVQPIWNGAGTVRVIITDAFNNPVAAGTVSGLQAELDPVAGQGKGTAPIGATVTVATPTAVTVTVSATVTFDTGYSLDGSGGTIALRLDIEAALSNYIDQLGPGDDVLLNRVEAQFFAVEGVYNVASVQLNAAAADVSIGALEVASMGTVTLT